jgi:hypothetical protein
MDSAGTVTKDQTDEPNNLEIYSRGTWNGKLSKYSVWILFTNGFLIKSLIYVFSFCVKLWSILLVNKMLYRKEVNVRDCKIVYYARKIHFLIFTFFVVDMSFYCARSFAHVKKFDDIQGSVNFYGALAIFTMLIIDMLSLYSTGNKLKNTMMVYH